MSKKNKMQYAKKTMSLVLSLILLVMLGTVAFAAPPIVLSETNVTVWPAANGEIFYGQKLSDGITLSGGEVQYDGAVVAGHFEFIDSDFYPTDGGANIAALKFIPDDLGSYAGFEIEYAWDVFYYVNPVTPVLVDENSPPVATQVEAGARLSTSTISGGAIKNPITNEIITDAVWKWESSRTKVNESGYYPARATSASSNGGYNPFTIDVYVRIAGDVPEVEIKEYPTVPELTYSPNVTWADIELTGGKAVIKGTETEVEGTFAIKNLTDIPNAKLTELAIVFTPANAEEALPYEFTIPVKVNALPISFGEDFKGTTADEPFEYEVAPGTMMRDILSYIKGGLLNYPTSSVTKIEDANSKAENGKVYMVSVLNYTNTNYTGSEAYIKTVFKDVEFTPTVKRSTGSGLNKFFIDCGDYRPEGTFTVYCNGEEIAEVKRGVVFDCAVYTDEGGTFEITTKYNPVENDYFIPASALWSITVNPVRHITVANTSSMPFTVNGNSGHTATIRTGDAIELEFLMEDFACFVIKDASGKEVTLEGVDLTSKKISFAMPDFDLKISVKTNAQLEEEEAIAGCGHICHSKNEIIQLFWRIISFFCRLFDIQQYCDCGITHYDAPLFGEIAL